MSFHTNWFF